MCEETEIVKDDFLKKEEIIFTTWKELTERQFSYVNKDDGTCGGRTPCYSTIQEAIDAANPGATIKIAEGSYDEALTPPNSSKDLTLQGGWDSTFTSQSSTTTVNSLTINNGSITVDNLVIQ